MKRKRINLVSHLTRVYVATLLVFALGTVNAEVKFGPQSSTTNVDWGFDFVETFDGIDDWNGSEFSGGNFSSINAMEGQPKLTDGSESAWNYFSYYSKETVENWIGEFGDHRTWSGKSATIDMGGTAGPSRLGLYFEHGYTDFYVFYMVNIPKNHFPTQSTNCANSSIVATYVEGDPYKYCAYYKFFTAQVDCPSAQCFSDNFGYSPTWNLILDFLRHGSGQPSDATDGLYFYGVSNQRDGTYVNRYGYNAKESLDNIFGNWVGIEYRMRIDDENVTVDAWIYNERGQIIQEPISGMTFPTIPEARGKRFNQIMFGGNNSWRYDPNTMDSTYNIDDVILDDQRIGPKYFSIRHGENPISPPKAPENFSATVQ